MNATEFRAIASKASENAVQMQEKARKRYELWITQRVEEYRLNMDAKLEAAANRGYTSASIKIGSRPDEFDGSYSDFLVEVLAKLKDSLVADGFTVEEEDNFDMITLTARV